MFKFIACFVVLIVMLPISYVKAEFSVRAPTGDTGLPTGQTNPPAVFHGEITPPGGPTPPSTPFSQEQDFYKATVQAYKDFNEQTVKYFSIALGAVSALVTIFVALFFFMFRRTLIEIKNDLERDADRLKDVYSRTFDLLNEQAKTNLEIFKSRELELKTAIKEGKELYENIRDAMKEISDIQRVREPVAEKLAEEEVIKVEEKRKAIKDEVADYKKDLEEYTKDKG
jgi:hypothetical protein